MNTNTNDQERAALEVLRATGINPLEAAMLARDALLSGNGKLRRAHLCLQAGKLALLTQEKTVCFSTAVKATLLARAGRRPRTLTDLRYLLRRIIKRCPGIARRSVRSITPDDCYKWLRKSFTTPLQRNKGRLALSSVFTTACAHGWCSRNPIHLVEPEPICEKRIVPLTHDEVERLLSVAKSFKNGICLPAVGIMLYAGVRPHEVERLTWEQIHLQHGVISILPQHSKTGGARHVTIHPPLAELLRPYMQPHGRICPQNWRRLWAEIHRLAGWQAESTPWQPDILRHTFASHHLAVFRSYSELQLEMGHRSSDLLRTRYISMPLDGWHLFSTPQPPTPQN